jgi:hypothetical protein
VRGEIGEVTVPGSFGMVRSLPEAETVLFG